MSNQKGKIFTQSKLKFLRKVRLKLQEFNEVNSLISMRKTLKLFSKRELQFLGECVYNFIYFGESLVPKEIYLFFQYLFLKANSLVRRNLYYFTFLSSSKKLKVSFGAKSYYLLVIVILSLLPVFDVFV